MKLVRRFGCAAARRDYAICRNQLLVAVATFAALGIALASSQPHWPSVWPVVY